MKRVLVSVVVMITLFGCPYILKLCIDESEESSGDDLSLFGHPYNTKTVENNISKKILIQIVSEISSMNAICLKLVSKSTKSLKDIFFGTPQSFSKIKGECTMKNVLLP